MALTIYAQAPWSFPNVPNFGGQLLASDPTIIIDSGTYRMFYTEAVDDGAMLRPGIAEAVSADGWTWTPLGGTTATGIVLSGGTANLEGASIFKAGSNYVLLYSAYADGGNPLPQFPASLHAAVSADGTHFTPVGTGPVLAPTAGWYDNDAVYSPTVVPWQGGYLMLYCGHSYTDASLTAGSFGVSLLAAFSPDGLSWTKQLTPVLRASTALSWMTGGVAEPSMIVGPDGKFYLFFTGMAGAERSIGIAVASDPLGPWEIAPGPIVTAQTAGLPQGGTVIAPHAELVNGVLRLWYTEVTPDGVHSVAYAQSSWGGTLTAPGQMPHWLGTGLDDVVVGTDSADRVTAAAGNDTVVTNGGNDIVDAGAGNDAIWAGLGNDNVSGFAGDDVIYLDAGADTGDGGDGADTLAGEAGNDILRGGLGNDTLDGGDDADTLNGDAGNDMIWAGAGDDNALGGTGDDLLYLDVGADTADGGDGADILAGEAGNDILRGGLGNDTLDGGDDVDTLYGDAGNDMLYGGSGNDLLYGGAGIDLLEGGAGDDRVDGGADADTLAGGTGRDSYFVDDAGDFVVELPGEGTADRVYASVDYVLTGLEVEILSTTTVAGTAAIDLTGNGQVNRLYGNAGNNILDGGFGSDTLTGYGGADSFVFRDELGPSNIDTITDFSTVDDTIWLDNAIFVLIDGTGLLATTQFRANTSGTAQDADDRVIYETDTGKLFYDGDGNAAGGAVQFGLLTAGLAVTNADFLIV